MKGYIYTMFAGADPGRGWKMTDPIFAPTPTLGACVPNIRRAVVPGDHIFVVSGRTPGVQQYVVGGFRVAEKIDALAAFDRFPENRLSLVGGQMLGNVIVDEQGRHDPRDYHGDFERRIENYIVGEHPVLLESPGEVQRGREETLGALQHLLNRAGDRVYDIVGRWRRLDERQIHDLVGWLSAIKSVPA